ncbi:hypothetical protein [Leptolyngbya sp. PCC 6406]|uniref:hypothetical protein n=1 Tax=Leptolyngbya sp. PCC 6406 TaxID=1173264 RepID=UPI0002AC4ED9|nr:hypothetical protein [Leptolyngbya sp. PCC 6406]
MKRRTWWWLGLAAIALIFTLVWRVPAASVAIAEPPAALIAQEPTPETEATETTETEATEATETEATETEATETEATETEATEAPETEATEANSAFPLSGTYEDPRNRFQIGLAEGYAVSTAAGSSLFTSPDGSLAYSLIHAPLNSETPLSEIGLVELARQVLGRGEGFQTQTFQPISTGLQIAWTGQFTQGMAPPAPISGTIVAQQRGAAVYLLVVAAQDAALEQLPEATSALVESLTIL